MKDLLEEYGERWRDAQPPAPLAEVAGLRDRRPGQAIGIAVAVVLAVVLGGSAVTVALQGGSPTSRPAQLSPGAIATSHLPRHAGTTADPVPFLDRPPGPADIPVSPELGDLGLLRYRCAQPVTGSLTFTASGRRERGLIRLTTGAMCTLGPDLTVDLESASGQPVARASSAPTSGSAAPPAASYPPVRFGGATPALAELTTTCGPAAVRAVINGTIVVPVSGLQRCAGSAAKASVTPLGAGYVPAVVPAGRGNLSVTLALPASAPVGGGSVAGLMTLTNPTAAAIPLSPCTAVGGTVAGKIHGVGSTFVSDLSFGLNCVQAPTAVPAHGSVVFAVELPTREGESGPVTVTIVIAGLEAAPPATVSLLDDSQIAAGTPADPVPWQNIPAGPDDIPGTDFSSGGGASAACTPALTGRLTMHVDGTRMLGSLQLANAGNACSVYPFLTISLAAADGRKLAATGDYAYRQLSQSTGYRPVYLGGAATRNGYAGITSPLICATGPVTATVSAGNGVRATVPVTGIPSTGCQAPGVQVISATPLGSGRAPAVPGPGYVRLRIGLRVPATTSGATVDARLTLRNATSDAIPLGRPCSAVTGSVSHAVPQGTAMDGLGFGLNCAQAPSSVPAHGTVVFDVHLTPPGRGQLSFTIGVGGIPGTATGTTQHGP